MLSLYGVICGPCGSQNTCFHHPPAFRWLMVLHAHNSLKSASLTRVFQQRWCQYSDLPCHSASEAAWNYTCTSREHCSMYVSSVLTIIIQSISASGGIDSLTYGSTICQNCSHFCVCVQLVNQLYRRHTIHTGTHCMPGGGGAPSYQCYCWQQR